MNTYQTVMLGFWTATLILTLFLELIFTSYFFLISGLSTIIPLILALTLANKYYIILQVIIYLLIWLILFVSMWKVFKVLKFFNPKNPHLNSLVGLKGFLSTPSYASNHRDFQYGSIKINGINYRTVNEVDDYLAKDSQVIITKVKGNRVFVKKIN